MGIISLDKYDISNTVKKRRICIGLAKHYVQIANLFAAIATTINPLYNYIDSEGNSITVSLEEKDTIPKKANPKIEVLQKYVGIKNEIISKGETRNYIFHINQEKNNKNINIKSHITTIISNIIVLKILNQVIEKHIFFAIKKTNN